MSLFALFVIAIGLAMDALAVSVSGGLNLGKHHLGKSLKMAVFFGFFQAMMPVIGYYAAIGFKSYIEQVDHWIAFGLLLFIGLKMIWEAFHEIPEDQKTDHFKIRTLLLLSIATSIDALAVGISFALLDIHLLTAVLMIGITTFILSFLGVLIGCRVGCHFSRWADIVGGVILIGIGLHILIEHTVL
ncbi:manganese efflux pump MntP family protein [Fidelibacter multiformis]|jgi:putative Mn2+ efflux pump MntP|uniref:manganese efflux pump MntP n=1 Tax=Fidelibacter multiformis TaxID=3377529 RepID=UPI0037DD3ED1